MALMSVTICCDGSSVPRKTATLQALPFTKGVSQEVKAQLDVYVHGARCVWGVLCGVLRSAHTPNMRIICS